MWRRAVAAHPPGVVTSADENLLSAYCEAVAGHQEATAAIKTQGRYIAGSTGQLVISPAVKDQAECARLILQLGAKLGFDPIARQSIQAPAGDDDDDDFGSVVPH